MDQCRRTGCVVRCNMDELDVDLGDIIHLLGHPSFPDRRNAPCRICPQGHAAGGFLARNGAMDRIGRIDYSLGLGPGNS